MIPGTAVRPRISVVIPTYNRSGLLRRTLESLTTQQLPAQEFEVIVSDDGSRDDTAAVVGSFTRRLRVQYHYQEDLGHRVAAARNAGAGLAAAPVVAFLDSGTLAGPAFLSGHLNAHATTQTPRLVLGYTFGYRPYDPTPGLAQAIATSTPAEVFERFRADPAFWDTRHKELLKVGFDLSRLALPWLFAWGLNLSLRARDFRDAGGFDEEFRSWGCEDLELGFRLARRGLAIWMSREAWAIEPPHERDVEAMRAGHRSTMSQFLRKTRDPAVEITCAVLERDRLWKAEDEYRLLSDWADKAHQIDVRPELENWAAGLTSAGQPKRACIVGCGADVPPSLGPSVLVDFDEQLLEKAAASGKHEKYHAIGLHLPIPDQYADAAIITSRLRGLWPHWREALLREARRVAREVRTPFPNDS